MDQELQHIQGADDGRRTIHRTPGYAVSHSVTVLLLWCINSP